MASGDLNAQIYSHAHTITFLIMHYALETEHQTKSSASSRTHESPHIKPKETQMGKQTYALTSGGLYDNGPMKQLELFVSHCQ
jgi:hypothetical protein